MKIVYFAWIKNKTGKSKEFIKEKKIKDINSLKKYLEKKYPKLKNYISKKDLIRIAINFKYTTKNTKLKNNDEIAFFPPVSGG